MTGYDCRQTSEHVARRARLEGDTSQYTRYSTVHTVYSTVQYTRRVAIKNIRTKYAEAEPTVLNQLGNLFV